MMEPGKKYPCMMDRIDSEGLILVHSESGSEVLVMPDLKNPFVKGKVVSVLIMEPMGENGFRGTLEKPVFELGEVEFLEVQRTSDVTYGLRWMGGQTLPAPKTGFPIPLSQGMMIPVRLSWDERRKRLFGDLQWKRDLIPATEENFYKSKEVEILVIDQTNLGFFVVVNHWFSGLVYFNQVFKKLRPGQRLPAFVNKVREDGKLDILLQRPGYGEVRDASSIVIEKLKEANGRLRIGDKSDPEEISALLGMSKKVFKKTIGALYKAGTVGLDDHAIWLLDGIEE